MGSESVLEIIWFVLHNLQVPSVMVQKKGTVHWYVTLDKRNSWGPL